MKTIGVILARAGSKGLPDKNGRTIAGKPMLAWTLEHALHSQSLNSIVLSTDSERYATIAAQYGIAVVERPEALANDTATIDAAARHALQSIEDRQHTAFDYAAILYGNIPVRPADLTDHAMKLLRETGADSVQSVYPVEKTHPYWMRTLGGERGDELGVWQPNSIYRRQDLPPVYMLNGGIIAVTWESLFTVSPKEPHAFLGKDRRAFVTPHDAVVDIDSEIDAMVAEAMLQRGEQQTLPEPLQTRRLAG